ncbi:MAG: hypothetical protein M1486_01330 [Gammaproteobacteria bacterium]|nr:hypothetical protein [Gammaproteobacteria bacterium]
MSWDRMELKEVDYSHWNYAVFVTLNEFIYLACGYEPLHVGAHGNAYLNLSNNEFKDYYKKVNRLGDELPVKTTPETIVKGFLTPEPKYEATFLLQWAKSKGIKINIKYNPIESDERKTKKFIQDYVGRLALFVNEFIKILAYCNPDKDEKYFKTRILEAIEVRSLSTIPLPFDGAVPFEQRNFKLHTQTLIDFAMKMKWLVPSELVELNNEPSEIKHSFEKEDDVHPKKLKSIYTVLLSMAVAKYKYEPNKVRNSATGGKAGSIKADVESLASNLGLENIKFNIKEDTVKDLLDEAVEALLQ